MELQRAGAAAKSGQTGDLLNLSVGGLSCRVPRSQTDRFPVDSGVEVILTVAEGSLPLRLPGRVCSVTRSAASEHTILGIMFLAGDELIEARARLANLTGERLNMRYDKP